jgi:2-dehydro-3-deoxy-D-arabinonate dehydratase
MPYLTKHQTARGARWAVDGRVLPGDFELGRLLELPAAEMPGFLRGTAVFSGATRTSQLKRPLQELVDYLRMELSFPQGVLLMTGTGIVPPDDFSLKPADRVRITIGGLTLENDVSST